MDRVVNGFGGGAGLPGNYELLGLDRPKGHTKWGV